MKMKLIFWLGFVVTAKVTQTSKEDVNINEVYLNDPRDVVGMKDYEPDQTTVNLNSQWLERIYDSPRMSNFVNSMIRINNTIPVTIASALSHIDESPYCWVWLAYHTEHDKNIYKELLELARGLETYFYGRCGVGLLDMSYPSNFHSFDEEVYKQSPCIVLRHPLKFKHMFDIREMMNPGIAVPMNSMAYWGKIYGAHEIGSELPQVLKTIDGVFERMPENYKIASGFMEHYNFGENSTELKVRNLFHAIRRNLYEESRQKAVKDGFGVLDLPMHALTDEVFPKFIEGMDHLDTIMKDLFVKADVRELLQVGLKMTYGFKEPVSLDPPEKPEPRFIFKLWQEMAVSEDNTVIDKLSQEHEEREDWSDEL